VQQKCIQILREYFGIQNDEGRSSICSYMFDL